MENDFKMKEKFTQEDFIDLLDLLHGYAFHANLYLYFLEQFDNEKYHHMFQRFPCTYVTLRNALIESIWLNLMRIYDRSTDHGWNIGVLLDMACDMCNSEHEYNGIFKEYKEHIKENQKDEIPAFDVKYTYFIRTFDKLPPTLKNKINDAENEREFINKLLNGKNSLKERPLEVKLTATELINHLAMLIDSQNKKIKNLNERRNKLFAHNDKNFLNDTNRQEFAKKHKLFTDDIQDLATIALRILMCVDTVINKDHIPEEQRVYKASHYGNQDDIIYVLDLLKKASDEEEKMIAE